MIETIKSKIETAMESKRGVNTYSDVMIMVLKRDNKNIKVIPRQSSSGDCDIQLVFETTIDNRTHARDMMLCPETLVDLGVVIVNYIEFLKTYEHEKEEESK